MLKKDVPMDNRDCLAEDGAIMKLIDACKKNVSADVKRIIADEKSAIHNKLNKKGDEEGNLALHVACFHSSCEIVELVLELGPLQDIPNTGGDLPIHSACLSTIEALEKVRLMVEYCSKSVNLRGTNNETPLHKAVAAQKSDVVEYLLDCGTNFTSDTRRTALHIATENGDVKIMNMLLSKGADVMTKIENGQTMAHLAIKHTQTDALNLVIRHSEMLVNRCDQDGNTPLHLAVRNQNIGAVQYLGAHSLCDVNLRNDKKKTPFDLARETSNNKLIDFFEYLDILHTFRESCEANDQRIVVNFKQNDILKKLINETVCDETVLHTACRSAGCTIVEHVLGLGAKTDIKDKHGDLPIHLASSSDIDPLKKVKALTKRNADHIHIKGSREKTALHRAAIKGRLDVVEYLVNKSVSFPCASSHTALHYAVLGGHLDVIEFLINNGGDIVNLQTEEGDTPLHCAVLRQDLDAVKALLLHRKCDINIQNQEGKTPVGQANDMPDRDILSFLQEYEVKNTRNVQSQGASSVSVVHPEERAFDKTTVSNEPMAKFTNDGTQLGSSTSHVIAQTIDNEQVKSAHEIVNPTKKEQAMSTHPLTEATTEEEVDQDTTEKIIGQPTADATNPSAQEPAIKKTLGGFMEGRMLSCSVLHSIAEFLGVESEHNSLAERLGFSQKRIDRARNWMTLKEATIELLMKWRDQPNQRNDKDKVEHLRTAFYDLRRADIVSFLEDVAKGEVGNLSVSKDREYMYRMDHKYRGYCFIVNNYEFEVPKREGSETDVENMKEVFVELGFEVRTEKNQTKKGLMEIIEEARQLDHGDMDCFVFAMLSHGTTDSICCTDLEEIKPDDIIEKFKGSNCSKLTGKPKIFLFQACRGQNLDKGAPYNSKGEDRPDAVTEYTSFEADILRASSSVPGNISYLNTKTGSWFISALTRVLRIHGEFRDMIWILTRANNMLAQRKAIHGGKQVAHIESTLTKQLYFIPKTVSQDTEPSFAAQVQLPTLQDEMHSNSAAAQIKLHSKPDVKLGNSATEAVTLDELP